MTAPDPVGLHGERFLVGWSGAFGGHMRAAGTDGGAVSTPLARLARECRRAASSDWGRVILAAVVVGAVMALSGGFGARHAPLLSRFAYGETLILVGVGLGFGGSRLLLPRPWFETRPFLAASLMTIIVGLPMTLVAAVGECMMEGVAFSIADLALVFPTTFATTLGIIVLAFMVQSRVVVQTHDAARGAPPPRFLARIPAKLAGASLWAVQAEDHYLRLHTSRGEDLILMRLADALVELEGIEGARTHRSWWVARAAVVDVERADGRATLTLQGGIEAPVSRGYMKALRLAGWF